ncbi:hypothetical protein [Sphingobium sp. CCH11-B1]|jgi:hypothetical protein|uniref:hypothetical protein n=1 Tax=Sphingobium sp. CCH11-B1 TaxID=1768781 RepID=UPI00082BE4E0|nr:hypothetical protein [Sphingobium sp. CCH11-B1]
MVGSTFSDHTKGHMLGPVLRHWSALSVLTLSACFFSPSDADIAAKCGVSEKEFVDGQANALSKPTGEFASIGKCRLMKTKDNTVVLATIEQFGSKK